MPSLALCKEDFCCGCHQYDSRSFTAGFLNPGIDLRDAFCRSLCLTHPNHAVKRRYVTHWTERREFDSRVFQRAKARKALLCTQLRFLVGYPIMNTITSYLFIYPICSCILRFPSLTKENLTYDTLPDVQERAHHKDVRPAHLIRPIVGLNIYRGIARLELHNYKTNVKPRLFYTNWISSFSSFC